MFCLVAGADQSHRMLAAIRMMRLKKPQVMRKWRCVEFNAILVELVTVDVIPYLEHIICLQDEQEPEGEDLVDSEEYEEDEEEDRLRKKRKKDSRYGGFIIDEAEVYNFFIFWKKI